MEGITIDYFNIETLNIPPRSTLYNLEPIGLGTPYVESLTSYISRLAECHNLNITTLVSKTFIPFVKTFHLQRSFMDRSLGANIKDINGNSPVSFDYVYALEELTTRKDLIYLTMILWSGLFSTTRVIDDYRKWCPICLEEFKNKDTDIYEPLIWCVKDIEVCDKHHVKLENKCPKCGKSLQFLHTNMIVGHCQYCFNWLGCISNNYSDPTKYQQFLLDSFKSLIANTSKLKSFPTKIKIGLVLKRIMEENKISSVPQLAKILDLNKNTLQGWINNKRSPSVESMFKICSKMNLSFYDLFCEDSTVKLNCNIAKKKRTRLTIKQIEDELINAIINKYKMGLFKLSEEKGFGARTAKKYFPSLCEEINAKYVKQKLEMKIQRTKTIKHALLTALETEPPISFTKFSEDFSILMNDAKKHYPELSNKLVYRYSCYREELTRNRIENTKSEIKAVVLELHEKGIYPGDKNIRKKLTNPLCILKPEFREVWKKELKMLGYK
ncbi:helix-turn-helix domain-containing protein [Bacillus sp. JJ1521]|uniref:helix-turn-helix domain-containing protein n=1 Tax=Bacillus sp. JJ1521 TaxID=3122957 RepID=UPI002FFEBD3E